VESLALFLRAAAATGYYGSRRSSGKNPIEAINVGGNSVCGIVEIGENS
jgi:hypothetical protein